MRKGLSILLVVLLVPLVGGLASLALRPGDPDFHGKPESVWIKSIGTKDHQAEIRQWQAFGSAGIPLLVKGLRKGSGPWDRFYSKLWPKLPSALSRRLSAPDDSRQVRIRAALILGRMSNDAQIAVPALTRALTDEDYGVRMNACVALNDLLPGMSKGKMNLLPRFMEAARDTNEGVRNNALVALRNYPDQASVVIPVVVNSLDDPDPHVRSTAVKSIAQLNLKPSLKPVVPVLLKLLEDGSAEVRKSATNALLAIDPETAAKAGVR